MNFYEHHLGDYMRDAGHLSFVEDAAYRRLMDAYYARERPLPLDIAECKKICRCRTAIEKRAVESVLSWFFVKMEDGFHQKRCDEVIAEYIAKQQKARESAYARWGKLDSERNANASENSMRPECDGNAVAMRLMGKNGCETHAPSPQSPIKSKRGGRKTPTTPLPDDFGLTPERQSYAEQHLPSVDASALMATFCSLSRSKGWRYVDWDQHWQTLVRQWAPNSGHWSSGQYPRKANGSADGEMRYADGRQVKW